MVDLGRIYWPWRHLLLGLVAGLGIGAFLICNFYYPAVDRTEAKIILTFDGITQGRYPDGAPFVPEDILSKVGIERALGKYPMGGMDVDSLYPHFYMTAEPKAEASGGGLGYRLGIALPASLSMDSAHQRLLISYLIEDFRGQILKRYENGVFVAAELPSDFISTWEYSVIFETFVARINALDGYLSSLRERPGSFSSMVSREDFRGLSQDVELFKTIELSILQTLIYGLGSARFPDLAIAEYQRRIEILKRTAEKALSKSNATLELFKEWANEAPGTQMSSNSVPVGTQGADDHENAVVFLMEQFLEAKYAALEAGFDMEHYAVRIKRIKAHVQQPLVDVKGTKTVIDARLTYLGGRLTEYEERVKKLFMDAVNETGWRHVRVVDTPHTMRVRGKNPYLMSAGVAGIGLLGGLVLILIVHFYRKKFASPPL